MTRRAPDIAIVGAGIGGLALSACLRLQGIETRIHEQARGFARLGAGIQQAPNAARVLRALGLESRLRAQAFQPDANTSRVHDTGETTFSLPLGRGVEDRHGIPYFLMHRGDLHEMLAAAVPAETIHLNRKLVGIDQSRGRVRMTFADGSTDTADAVIGCDGVHSVVRETPFGAERPRFTGRVAYRAVFPTRLLNGLEVDPCVKWWGPDRHIVSYFTNPRRDELYFVTSTPEPNFGVESWSAKGDMATLRAHYEGFHPQVRAILDACPEAHKWALVVRDPMESWVEGNIALLGDACHPMTPYMAQGAATSLEDAAVLSRCLAGIEPDGIHAALRRYEATRKPRTSRIQITSAQNTWLKDSTDPDWVYGYDAWSVPLAEPAAA